MASATRPPRRASILFEVQIGFAVLGIGLAGLCPIVVAKYRQLRLLEQRFEADSYTFKNLGRPAVTRSIGRVYHLTPWKNPWARKLTARACISATGDNPVDEGEAEAVPPAPLVKLISVEIQTVAGEAAEIAAAVELD